MLGTLIKSCNPNVARVVALRRGLATSAPRNANPKQLENFNPERYDIPLRPVTMDDLMEPYGSWKVAYEAERKRANKSLFLGIVSIFCSVTFLIQSGVFDPAIMPNLDNIMEDTHPFEFDKEGRTTV